MNLKCHNKGQPNITVSHSKYVMDLGACSIVTLVNFTRSISKYSGPKCVGLLCTFQKIHIYTILKCRTKDLEYNNNNNNNNNKLQLGCNPVAVVILHVYKT